MYRKTASTSLLAALSLLMGAANLRAEDPPKPPPDETDTTQPAASNDAAPSEAPPKFDLGLGPNLADPFAPPKTEADVKDFVVNSIVEQAKASGNPISEERLAQITQGLAIKQGEDGKPDALSQAFMQGLIEDLQRGDDVQPQFDADGNIMGFCNNTAQLCRGNPFDSLDPSMGATTGDVQTAANNASPALGAAGARSMGPEPETTGNDGDPNGQAPTQDPAPDLLANNIIQNDAPVTDSQVDNLLNSLSQSEPPTSTYSGDPADHPAAGDCTTCGGSAQGGFGGGFSASNTGGKEVPMFQAGMDRNTAKERLNTLQSQYKAAQSPEAVERLLRGPDPDQVPISQIPARLAASASYLQAVDSNQFGAQAIRDPNDDGAKARVQRSMSDYPNRGMRESKETCERAGAFGTVVRGVVVDGACR